MLHTQSPGNETTPASTNRRGGWWGWGLVAAAAVSLLIANPFKSEFREVPETRTGGTVHLSSATKISEHPETAAATAPPQTGLRDALLAQDISTALAPSWVPGGYVEGDVRFTQLPSRTVFMTQYQCGEEFIIVRLSHHSDTDPLYLAQKPSLVEIYESNGVPYHIYSAEEMLQTVWLNGDFDGYIAGPLTLSEMKRMIDSIA